MTRLRALVIPILALALGLAGCGGSGGGSSNRSGGAPRESPGGVEPRRIISCAPNLTEMLFALGAGPRVIGVTRFCQFPAEARSRPPLGDLYQPNLEAMVAARPHLIVLVPGNRKVIDFFAGRAGAPRILETNACETVADIQATLRQLGEALGAVDRAEEMISAMQAGLDSVAREYSAAPPVRYLMILGHDEGSLEQIYAVGPPTYLSELAALAGGQNVIGPELGRYPIISREAILAMNPDVIIERSLGGPVTPGRRALLVSLWKGLPSLKAVRADRVVVMDDDHVTINGPDLARSARVLARLLRP